MKSKLIILITLLVFLTGCNVLINPTHGIIEIKQNNTTIEHETGVYNFGSIPVNDYSSEIAFVVENIGTTKLQLTGKPKINISGADLSMFIIDQMMTKSPISPGDSTEFTIKFNPKSIGLKSATISVENSDPSKDPYTFTVTGTGIAPEINVKQGSTNIPSGTGMYNIGLAVVNGASLAIAFTIENLGVVDLNLIGAPKIQILGTDSSMFIIDQSMTISPVLPGNSTVFTVKFNPKSIGLKSATISIANNDSNKNPYTFKIVGTGVSPEINVQQGSTNIPNGTGEYNFGIVKINDTSSAITFTIENLGTSNLNLTGTPKIQISGSDASMFIINHTMTNSSIAPSISTSFTVSFHPTSEGLKSATILIMNDDLDENPYNFKIIGQCVPIYCWTKKVEATFQNYGNLMTIDSSGNIYVTGNFYGTVDFGTEFGVTDVKSALGSYDIFITKIIANGTYGWTKRMGGHDFDKASSITTDTSGNIYVTGQFNDTVNFGIDFGVSEIKTPIGSYDIFITKIIANGTYGWTKRMGGPGGDSGVSITTDTSGNIYVTGQFNDTVNFGIDFGVTDIKSALSSYDIFITKINVNGTYGWTKRMGGSQSDHGFSITTDSSGNIFVTGRFHGTVDFGADFGVSDMKTSASTLDAFITKINANGTYGWTKRMGGLGHQEGRSITVDSSGHIYVTGEFHDTVDFGADFGVSDIKTSADLTDIFITKINANGTYGWTKSMGGTYIDRGYSITTDSSDNIYLAGNFGGTVDFGADFGVSDSKTSAGLYDIFITKINANGTYGWTKRMGGVSNDLVYSITIDSSNNLYIAGIFSGTVDFGADFGVSDSKTSTGSINIFITKICL